MGGVRTSREGKDTIASWDFIKNAIDKETEKCVPKKRRRTGCKPLWMTRNVMRLIRKKRRAWRWYTTSLYCSQDHEEFQAFRKVQAQVKKAVRLPYKYSVGKLVKITITYSSSAVTVCLSVIAVY